MTQPLTWNHTPIPEMDFGLSIQESHGFSRVECQYNLYLEFETEAAVTVKSIAKELEMTTTELRKIVKKHKGIVDDEKQMRFFSREDIDSAAEELVPKVMMQKLLGR